MLAIDIPSLRHLLLIFTTLLASLYASLFLIAYYTNVKIGRLGWFSICAIKLPSRNGVTIKIGSIGLSIHRPTVARSSWLTITVQGLMITIDSAKLSASKIDVEGEQDQQPTSTPPNLAHIVRRIRKITDHSLIGWCEFKILETNLLFIDTGQIQLGTIIIRIKDRPTHGSRRLSKSRSIESGLSTLFNQESNANRRGPELVLQGADLRFKLDGENPFDVVDLFLINAWGDYNDTDSLENLGASLKIGKLVIVGEDVFEFLHRLREANLHSYRTVNSHASGTEQSSATQISARDDVDSEHSDIVDLLTEIQIHVGYFKISHQIDDVQPAGKPVMLTASSKDMVLDFNRLEADSPGHRMLFAAGSVAHQGLLSAISATLEIGMAGQVQDIVTIPMSTVALKTSALARLLRHPTSLDAMDDSDVLNISAVVTSPAIDVRSEQISTLLAICRSREEKQASKGSRPQKIQLPRINSAFSVHDPSFRVVLDKVSSDELPPMVIGRASSIALDADGRQVKDDYSIATFARLAAGRLYYHSPENHEHNIMKVDNANFEVALNLLPLNNGRATANVDGLVFELLQPDIVAYLARILSSMRKPEILPAKLPASITAKSTKNPLDIIPDWLEFATMQLRNSSILIAGIDPEVASDPRGLKLAIEEIYLVQGIRSCDLEQALIQHDRLSEMLSTSKGPAQEESDSVSRSFMSYFQHVRVSTLDALNKLNTREPMLDIPWLCGSLVLRSHMEVPLLHTVIKAERVLLGFSLFKVYATLQALQVLRTALCWRATKPSPHHEIHKSSAHLLAPITVDLRIALIRIKAVLPLDKRMMLDVENLHISKKQKHDFAVHLQYLRAYTDSKTYVGSWDRIFSLREIYLSRETHTEQGAAGITASKTMVIRTDALRIRIPHQFIFYETLEALINSSKTTVQIIHRFITQTNDYVIAQHPKVPKELPRIRVKSKSLEIIMEDDPFESRLGMIFRVGLQEQRMREARDAAFDRKIVREGDSYSNFASYTDERSSARSEPDSGKVFPNFPKSIANHNDFKDERDELSRYNASAWITRIRFAFEKRRQTMSDLRQSRWGKDSISEHARYKERILDLPSRPPLFSVYFQGVDLILDRPSFDLKSLPDYMHRVGRGMPKDSQYGLIIPVSLKWSMDEALIQLRDYPLPLMHVPPLHAAQRGKMRSWQLSTDLVIAEEFPDYDAIRHVDVCVIPKDTGRIGSPAFSVEVQRTANAVKTYAEINIDLNSSIPTKIHWGTSMQAAISDVARLFETLSKPQQDPSPKLGFWDKIGLVMHTSLKLNWIPSGEIHVSIKGSRDPYIIMGVGAGITKVFRGDVRWEIGVHPDSRHLMSVRCREYLLAIPDFSRNAAGAGPPRRNTTDDEVGDPLHFYHQSRKEIAFQKILMKLTGDVHWVAGLAFERHCDLEDCKSCGGQGECRHWDFKSHWEVKMRIPKYSILPGGELRDAFKGYRSHYIHGHISVTSQRHEGGNQSYNTMHLSPKAFAHFFDWLHSFSGNLSLPIRTGSLFPTGEGPKQKFGQHLRTLKYTLCLRPLYLTHVYKAVDLHDVNKVEYTGVKAKIESFTLDLHQRKEERIITNKQLESVRNSSHMAIYRGQVDLESTDLRALTAIFEDDVIADDQSDIHERDPLDTEHGTKLKSAARLGEFDVSSENLAWIDMDDFMEVDSLLPTRSPRCRILPLAYSPRFLYDRDTTQKEGSMYAQGSSNVVIPGQRFGFEKTHKCAMITFDGKNVNEGKKIQFSILTPKDFGHVQRELWAERRDYVTKELSENKVQLLETQEALNLTPNSNTLSVQLKMLQDQTVLLTARLKIINAISTDTNRFFEAEREDSLTAQACDTDEILYNSGDYLEEVKKEVFAFNNRFIVHHIQLKWNNTLRNILIRYVQQINQRRGFTYYMSQTAVRFLADLVDEQAKHEARERAQQVDPTLKRMESEEDNQNSNGLSQDAEKLLRLLLDGIEHNFNVSDETMAREDTKTEELTPTTTPRPHDPLLHQDHVSINNYLFRLINPQIQLQSEQNDGAAVVLAATSMSLKIRAINDQTMSADDVSALVARKFHLRMSGAQFFYAEEKNFHGSMASLLTHNCYGSTRQSYWPPWIPVEATHDFENSPRAFDRIVDKTSIFGTYTKHNTLRIKKSESLETETFSQREADDRTDSISVRFPKFKLTANSAQYYTMFTIAMDLLMYTEPLQKERNEQIEKLLLAADFSDLSGAPEMVSLLQKRIRLLNDFKVQFKLHAQRHDPQSRKDELNVEKRLTQFEDELFFLMKSVATAQQKQEERVNEVVPAMKWHIEAEEILWHLTDGQKAFIDFGLSQASFSRTDNSDSSNFNTMEIEMMQGINLSTNPVFTDLFAPYFGSDRTVVDARRSKMVRVYWCMLEAIGGISVCDHFEVNLFPLRIQMEHEVGKKIFAYVFPEKNGAQQKKQESDTEDDNGDDGDLSDSTMGDFDVTSQTSRDSGRSPYKRDNKLSFDSLRHPTAFARRLGKRTSHSQLRPDSASFDSDAGSINGPATSSVSLSYLTTKDKNVTKSKGKKNVPSDDMTAMLDRASQNMSLVYVKVPSVVLALSYKGAKAKNFTDVNNFVFKMPTIEYRNKTWSYLDLAEHLKREVIKAVLAHTGSLLRDKITHRRTAKSQQPSIARQLTSYRTYVPVDQTGRPKVEAVEEPDRNGTEATTKFIPPLQLQNRTTSAETTSLHESNGNGSGLFNNAIGRHVKHLSHMARHRDGLADDNDESTLKKTRLLLGKFIDKAR